MALITRRTFLRMSALTAAAGAASASYARWIEPFWVEYVDHPLPIAGLPEALAGKTLMQLSDLHVGHVDQPFLLRSLSEAARLQPDWVVYTGDFVTVGNTPSMDPVDEVLSVAPRGRLGTVAIFGNHDFGRNWSYPGRAAVIQRHLEQAGIPVLRNTSALVGGLRIVGFDDLWSPTFGGASVMAAVPEGEPTLVLCHNPDACDLPIWGNYQGWILSGHTHGGQVKLPLVGAPFVPVKNKRYVEGTYDVGGGRQCYINRALGHLFQVRFLARPEITLHRLTRA